MMGLNKAFIVFLCISVALVLIELTAGQIDRVSAFSVDFEGKGYDEWRLPKGADNTFVYGYDATTGTLITCKRTDIDRGRDIPLFPAGPDTSSSDREAGAAGIKSSTALPSPCIPDFPF